MTAGVQEIDYIDRWRAIVERRREQMDAAYAKAGIDSSDYWARRAKSYREALHAPMGDDPLFVRLRGAVTTASTVLDVGAGTGRHTLALAPHVARVTAVDPSAAMLALLREDAAHNGLTNIDSLESAWIDAEVEHHDVLLCSHVLYPIADIEPFVRKLAARARQRVFVYTRVDPLPTDMGLWSEFYGEPLQGQPTHMDLLNALAHMEIYPDVEVVEHRFTWTFASLDEAVSHMRNSLCLRDDDAAAGTRLRSLLDERLEHWPDGRLGPRIGRARSAIISWAPA